MVVLLGGRALESLGPLKQGCGQSSNSATMDEQHDWEGCSPVSAVGCPGLISWWSKSRPCADWPDTTLRGYWRDHCHVCNIMRFCSKAGDVSTVRWVISSIRLKFFFLYILLNIFLIVMYLYCNYKWNLHCISLYFPSSEIALKKLYRNTSLISFKKKIFFGTIK